MRLSALFAAASLILAGQENRPLAADVQDDPKLPRVLLVGDSISIGYTPAVRAALSGKANVHRVPGNAGPSSNGIFLMDTWFGSDKWDVIHFNFGLHDLKRMSDGKQQVLPEQYERYLRLFTERAKKTGAVLIFATTTPVPAGKVSPPRISADVVTYNNIALRVMKENDVAVDDLYEFALPHLSEWQQPINVHFHPQGYQALAGQVSASVQRRLAH